MKRTLKWISILTLSIVALYFAGVYATGYAIRYGLKNIDQYVKKGLNVQTNAKNVDDIFELSYTSEKSSLFTENGYISLKIDKSVKKTPVNFSIGFVNADFFADTSAVNSTVFKLFDDVLEDFLGQSIDRSIKLTSSKSSIKGSAGILKGAQVDVLFNAPYKSNKKKLTFEALVNASLSKNISVYVNSSDLFFDNFSAKKLELNLGFCGFDRLERFDSFNLSADNLSLSNLKFTDLNLIATGINNTDESFDVKIDLKSKEIVNSVSDVKAVMIAKGLSYDEINSALKEGDLDRCFDSLNRIDISKFDAVLDNSLKTYVGVFRKNAIKFSSNGYLKFDSNNDVFLQEAFLSVKTNDAKGAEFLFKKKNGEYVCNLEYKNERLYINGMRL